MVNDDVVKCPLCGGFTHIEKPDLLQALKNPRLREQVELYITELLKSPVEDLSTVGATQAGRDFQKDVHSWNPCVPHVAEKPERVNALSRQESGGQAFVRILQPPLDGARAVVATLTSPVGSPESLPDTWRGV